MKDAANVHTLPGRSARPAAPPGPPTPLKQVRLRLRLALLTMAIVPMALSMALLKLTLGPEMTETAVGALALMIGLTLLLVALIVWMTRQILRPAEDLERSRLQFHRMYEAARDDSLKDGLTGLGNHRAFHEELDRELEWYHRYKVPFALLLLDLDDLKLVNDSDGHAAGDEVLRAMGGLIHETTRYADRAFRIGGDEFGILMPHTDADGALQIARRLQERATRTRGRDRAIAFSGGVSACPASATTREQIYSQADAALYWCKRHGRGVVDVFHPLRDQLASEEGSKETSAALARVVSERLLRPVYQPIVDLATGRVIGYEGLIRPSPESTFSDPGSMFKAAEAVGRTVELDQACINAVVAGARAIPIDQLLTLNVSPRTVEAPHFTAEGLLVILARYGIAPGRVVIELTERESVEDTARLQANLAAVQRAGIRIAADDVGAGNAGLRLLSQLRFDVVKIDLALVQEGSERDSSRAVLRSLRDLASRWGASVIAEGIETVSQLRTVRELGLSAGQGYLLARPMADPTMTTIDIAAIEAGGMVLDRRSRPADPHAAAGIPAAS